jgi:hypothetical protein
MAVTYTYADQLPSDSKSRLIRVFDLDPPQSTTDETIRGTLRVVSLDDDPSYDALSYAWGKPPPSGHVTCAPSQL